MRTRVIGLVLGGWLAGLAAAAPAAELSEALRQAIEGDIETIEQECPEMGEVMAALREAGVAYVPELTAPVDVDRYQVLDLRQVMIGVYLMDLNYASTFDRQTEAARRGEAVTRLLELTGYPQPGLEQRYREALAEIDQPGGDERLQELIREQEQSKPWQDKLQTSEGVKFAADSLYGFLLEGLYLTTELCRLSDYDPGSMAYVAYLRDSFQAYQKLLDRMGQSREFASWVEANDRMNFLVSLFVILGDKPYVAPAQLDALRPAIENARKRIVR